MKLETKVGLFFTIGIAMLFALSTQVGSFNLIKDDTYNISVQLSDINGLEKNAKVKSRGINIGKVDSFELLNDKVLVKLNINKNVKIPSQSSVSIKQESMLGGKYVDIKFSNKMKILLNNDILKNNTSFASFDQTSDTINSTAVNLNKFIIRLDKLIAQNEMNFTQLLENFKEAGGEFRETGKTINLKLPKIMDEIYNMASEFKHTGQTINSDLPLLLSKYKNLADEFKNVALLINQDLPKVMNKYSNVADEFTKTGKIINIKLPNIMNKFSKVEDGILNIIDDNRNNIKKTILNIDSTFSEIKSASGKIESSFEKIDKYLSSTTKSRLGIEFDTSYMINDKYNKTNFFIDYSPKPTIHYLAGLTTSNDFRLGKNTKIHEDNRNLVSAQYGKDFNKFRLRAGIFEGTGGVGFDYFKNNKKLKLTFDAFDFNAYNDARGEKAHLRAIAKYTIKKHLQIYTGYDNFLNKDARTVYFGLGVKFEDNDLKYLLGSASSLK